MCRVYHQGQIKRLLASRVAWVLGGANEWPHGVVRHRDGDEHNFAASNLIETKRGPRPFDQGKGGKASSLDRRANATTTLLQTLSAHPGSTVPQISKLVGSSTSCTCVRLSKLADAGLCVGPKCDARARWDLTPAGKALAAAANPVVLDDLDRQVLAALALTAMGTVKLARRVEVCPMTIRRRVRSLVENGLVFADPRRFYVVTDKGRDLLGPDALPPRWINTAAISAVSARDVQARHGEAPTDDRTAAQRAANAQMARGRPRGGKQALMRAMAV
jgi:predicted transcriptional regulator